MSHSKQQLTGSMGGLLHRLQILHRRLLLLLGIVLLIVMPFIGAGAACLVIPAKGDGWLLVGGAIFLLGILAMGMMIHILRHYIIQPLATLPPELEFIEQEPVDRSVETFAGGMNNFDDDLSQSVIEGEAEEIKEGPRELSPTNSEERYRQLVEFSPDGIAVHSESRIVFINAAGAKLLGATHPEQLIDRSMMDFVHPDYREIIEKQGQGVIEERQQTPFIAAKFVRLDGQVVDVEVARNPSTYQNKPAAQLVFRDITDRKQIEAEIIRRNQQLTILQAAGATITSSLDLRYVLDTVTQEMTKLIGVESCAISEWNQADNTISRVAKYGPAGWWDPRSSAKDYDLADYPLTRGVLEDQIPEQMTINQPTIDPAECAYMQEANIKTRMLLPMIFQRQVVGLVELEDSRVERTFTYQEISLAQLLANQAGSAIENARLYEQARQEIKERQRAEAALQDERALLAQRVEERTAELSKANAELARASRLKDEFLAGMSHELRTPLNTILGSSEILQSEVFGSINEKQLKYLENVEESGHHLLSLINDILDLSKIEAGKVELDITPVAVGSVCEASLRLVKQMAHKKRLKVSQNLDNMVSMVPADERRLKQILVNLLSNAVKFTPEGGEIGLEVVGDAAQQVVHFTVWDTGIGIARKDMRRLFQPFVQLDSKLSRQYAGTGLGLSLVSRMTELHGGGVSVESEVGQGSRFTVSLPWPGPAGAMSVTEEERTEGSRLAVSSGHERKVEQPLILLAEDNEDTINLFLDHLRVQGYLVVVARNGAEAVARATEKKPDVILMDIQMPGMDGLEATRRLRAAAGLAKVPIIALTALAMPGDRDRCLKAGASEYLSKPVSLERLVKTVEAHLG